jgi:hypothetical protein
VSYIKSIGRGIKEEEAKNNEIEIQEAQDFDDDMTNEQFVIRYSDLMA